MAEMTSVERVMRTLRREEVDRIPHFEWIIDRRVRHALCPGSTTEEFTVRMGLDAMLTAPDFNKEQIGPNRFKNEWGSIQEKGMEEHSIVVEGPIKTLEDLQKYEPPDPYAPNRYKSLEKIVNEYKGIYAIGVHLNDVLTIPRNLMGFENLMMAFAANTQLVKELVELSVNINIQMVAEIAKRGADFIFTGDDYASTAAPLMSPKMFEEYLYPGLKQVVAAFHAEGLPVIKHTDGNIKPILDMIIDSGIDCLDPLDPLAGMDMVEVKQKYGHRIALKGNVDCAHTLSFGSVEDVVKETLQVIQNAGPGGGIIISSSNSIHSAVKPGNYLAMVNTIKTYGKYPIDLSFKGTKAVDAFS
jgi:uroporphyrinogen decarboxylase